ncbi:MAG: bifunctional enoyl-CoA hydratase/phosphate acetyltransferase [Paracoccaceae bacterium]
MSRILQNVPFDQLTIGMEATQKRLCRHDDLFVFANSSGNLNPLHLPGEDGDGDGAPEAQAPGMWVASLISGVLGCELPGPGSQYREQSLRFVGQAQAGDTLVAGVRLVAKEGDGTVRFDTWVEREDGMRIVEGEAEVVAPTQPMTFDAHDVPGLTVQRHVHFERLLKRAEPLLAIPTAVIAPEEPEALGGALLAAEHTIVDPILIGDATLIRQAAEEIGKDIASYQVIDIPGHRAATARGVELIHSGEARALMKGHLHTSTLLSEVVKRDGGLRVSRLLSHVFVMDVPGLDHLLMVTDAAINIAPDLKQKADIVKNAIDLGHSLGLKQPRVAILSAVETVNPSIPSTLDAAALAKMAERGQITGGLVDGPLAMDNAINLGAARTKGIHSEVAGRAEILIAPNMEAGNMIAKELSFLAHAESAGIVVGAKCPIILTSRADDETARLVSCAVAALHTVGEDA